MESKIRPFRVLTLFVLGKFISPLNFQVSNMLVLLPNVKTIPSKAATKSAKSFA